MRTINTYTLKQYKGCYPDLLERHKLEYEDYNEYTFINTELESFHDGFIEIEDIEELPFQFQFQKSFTDDELRESLVNQREFKDFAVKSNLSSSMIIDFLESRLQELEKELNLKVSTHKKVDKTELTLEEIALKLVWEGENVTRENAQDFLIGTKLTSGDKLYNHFKFYRNNNDRRSNPDPDRKVKLKNKIERFEKVIKTLDDEFKQKAEDELKTLKRHLSKD